jgi:hypothetical protein
MPRVTINLMRAATRENDPFFGKMVDSFYRETQARHWRRGFQKRWRHGVALCVLPKTFDDYFMQIEAAGRRNFKKATRNGYVFARIVHNDNLAGMTAIHRSTDIRQGTMPAEFLALEVKPNADPPSRSNIHDYPYFGILKDGKLVAYAGCMVSGEVCTIDQIYGHAEHHADGVVPLLILNMAQYVMAHYPGVKYYVYDMFFGASETMRRFKRKFCFTPHKVKWVLG